MLESIGKISQGIDDARARLKSADEMIVEMSKTRNEILILVARLEAQRDLLLIYGELPKVSN